MKDEVRERRGAFGWGLPASVAVHLAVAALVIFGLPVSLLEPQAEQAVEVELTPPPEQAEKAEPPAAQEEEKQEAKAEPPPPASDQAARPAAAPVLRPVFQFGEKDAGPRQAFDGDSPEDGAAAPEARNEPHEPSKPEEPSERQEQAEQPSPLAAAEAHEKLAVPPEEPEPEPAEEPAPEPADVEERAAETASSKEEASEPQVTTLFSHSATGDAQATTAMGDVPRGVRAGRLCVTELREQMRRAMPPYFPDLLPSYRLPAGTVLEVKTAAFRMNGEWYDLSYRCEVDTDATRVLSFAFSVGDRLPPSEWQRRGLPVR